MSGVAEIANVSKSDVWVYLSNLAATDMGEYGQLLSEPGKEKEWYHSLPKEVQQMLTEMPEL